MKKAIFLDRDGTINIDKEYVYKIVDFEFLPGVKDALILLCQAGYRLVIISNQSGVARGYYSEEDIWTLHNWLLETLASDGIIIAGIYYCPHHPKAHIEAYRMECGCRKPGLDLFHKAISELKLDINHSIAIGNKMRDLQICRYSDCRGYLLGVSEPETSLPTSVLRVADLLSAAKDIISKDFLKK